MKKRKWIYVHKPVDFEMQCDKCEGINIEWSEYKGMIWCYDCKIDTKGTGGILNGPVPVNVLEIFGLSLDRFCLETKKVLKMHIEEGKLTWK